MKIYTMLLILAFLTGCENQSNEDAWNDIQPTTGNFFSKLFAIEEEDGPAGAQSSINDGDSMHSVRTKLNNTFTEVGALETTVAGHTTTIATLVGNSFSGSYNDLTDKPTILSEAEVITIVDNQLDGMATYSYLGTTATIPGRCYLYTGSNWVLPDTTNLYSGVVGMATGSSSTNGMLLRGYYTTTAYTPGDNLYLDMSTSTGVLTATQPANSGDIVRYIGTKMQDKIYFNPSTIFIKLD